MNKNFKKVLFNLIYLKTIHKPLDCRKKKEKIRNSYQNTPKNCLFFDGSMYNFTLLRNEKTNKKN